MADLALPGQSVALSGQVNNYADAAFSLLGGAGSFTNTGLNSFTLNFGTVNQGSDLLANLSILNTASGTADSLGGSFDVTGSNFNFLGFDSFANIAAGGQQNGLSINFITAALATGNYFADVTFHGVGANASGYSGSIGDYHLHISGTISAVPLPGAVWLFGIGLTGLAALRRKSTAPQG